MENNIFETNHLSDEDKVKIVYEKYRIDAENLYLAAVKRWKKHLLIYMVLTVVSFIALLLFIFDIYGFMHLFYMFVSGLLLFLVALLVRRPIKIFAQKSRYISSVCAMQSIAWNIWDCILRFHKKTMTSLIAGGTECTCKFLQH